MREGNARREDALREVTCGGGGRRVWGERVSASEGGGRIRVAKKRSKIGRAHV